MHLRWKIMIVLCVAAVLVDVHSATAQTKKRIIDLLSPESPAKHKDEIDLEIVEIKIAGRPIALGQSFDADDNWLKDMTLRVKNVGTKPIAFFDIGGALFERMDEELAWDQSFRYLFAWNWGRDSTRKKKRLKGPALKPGESVELTYANADSFQLSTIAQGKGEGAFCKLEFTAWAIEYIDGTEPDVPRMRFPKPH